jgi:hypothetical protein
MNKYPDAFSGEARATVEAELVRARRRHLERKQDLGKSLKTYILEVFRVYANEVIKLGELGIWTVDQVRREALEGLRLTTNAVCSGTRFGYWIGSWGGLEAEFEKEMTKSAEWTHFEDQLLELADREASKNSVAQSNDEQTPVPRAVWESIELVFLSEQLLQVYIAGQPRPPQNYAELGFQDGRNEAPNKAWALLLRFAELGGTIQNAKEAQMEWTNVEKHVQAMRKVLQELFLLEEDPLPFIKGTGYKARFAIRCGPSYYGSSNFRHSPDRLL